MKTLKVNFTIPEDIVQALNSRVERRRRSAFVTMAVRDKLRQVEQEELINRLVEGYRVLAEEDAAEEHEWETGSLEGWPE